MRVIPASSATRNAVVSVILSQMVSILCLSSVNLSNRAAVSAHLTSAGFGVVTVTRLSDRARVSAISRRAMN